MATYLGNLTSFDHNTQEWEIFRGRMEQFFVLNKTEDDVKGAVLLTHLQDDTYRLLKNLVYPIKVKDVRYTELVRALDNHFTPKRCTFADKCKFYEATRGVGESVEEWAARVRGLAVHCEFGSSLDILLRDKFVLGLRAGKECERLFEQDAATLLLAKAVELAQQAECAQLARAAAVVATVKQEPVYRASASAQPGRRDAGAGTRSCSVCGLKSHDASRCRYKNYRCQVCGERGHLKKMCASKKVSKCRLHNVETKELSVLNECDNCRECELLSLSALLVVALAERRFPDGFKFGAATAAYQVEGAWNVSDKGESIWDRFVHTKPEAISDRSTGDVACDSYHLWEQDLQLAADLNLDFYRFSIAWSRVLPTGFPNHVSEDGVRYYGNLIDGLLARGIEPVVTLYHWDLPQRLQDLGGWTNPLVVDWFVDYARIMFDKYGSRVKTWITINEAVVVCDLAYTGYLAPGIESEFYGSYACTKNILLAHAKAYRLYEKEYKPKYHGEVSLSNQLFWLEPETENDVELTELCKEITIGRYSHPVYSAEGGWPPALERYIAEKSQREGFPRSRLPAFTREEIDLIKGSYDFYGLNHYTTRTVRHAKAGDDPRLFLFEGVKELGAFFAGKPNWPTTASFWFLVHPEGFRDTLVYLKQQYGDVKILISENGLADSGDALDDQPRVDYYRDYLAQVLLAMKEDGVNVMGYTAWSLMDNFEWMNGYESRFGLHHVDFTSPARTRTPRRSARYYAQVAKTGDIDAPYEFDN